MTAPAPAPPTPPPSRGRQIAIAFGVLAAVIVVYALSLIAMHLMAKSAPPLPAVDVNKVEADDSVVQVSLGELKTVQNQLSVNVLVYPKDSLYDRTFGTLTTDAAVRLYLGDNVSALGDLQYPVGKAPAQVSTNIVAHGDPGNWPFDKYTTEVISADVFTGTGPSREKAPARVEVAGRLDGWDASVTRVHDPEDPNPDNKENVIITLHRAKGPLIFDVGICMVLIALPILALWVAIPVALGRTSFLPPMTTWYGAMLFAIVPLRSILPGSPPYGSWIDQAVVLWVLLALVAGLTLFLVGWWRQRDRRTPSKKG